MKRIVLTAFLAAVFTVVTSYAQELTWQRSDLYVAPDFESFFLDNEEGGKRLDALWQSPDKDTVADTEILKTVRDGLRRTKQQRASILRWIGNRYIWGKSPQNPDAIEIMYHAADFSGEKADPYGTRHYAVYFGLSTVRKKSEKVVRRLLEMAFEDREDNLYGRIAWGLSADRETAARILDGYINGNDPKLAAQAREIYKDMTGSDCTNK